MSGLLKLGLWITNAALFIMVGVAIGGFGFIIADTFFGFAAGLLAGLATFLIAGFLTVWGTTAIAQRLFE